MFAQRRTLRALCAAPLISLALPRAVEIFDPVTGVVCNADPMAESNRIESADRRFGCARTLRRGLHAIHAQR